MPVHVDNSPVIIRAASKNERRYITRHALDFYRALTMTGLYVLDIERASSLPEDTKGGNALDPLKIETYIPALKRCIVAHPSLRTTIHGAHGESPAFALPGNMDLRRHVRVRDLDVGLGESGGQEDALRRALRETLDEGFEDVERVPPWRIVVLPLPASNHRCDGDGDGDEEGKVRIYIIFAYSHSVGDGRSGLVFHKTFLEGLRIGHQTYDRGYEFDLTDDALVKELPPPLEEVCTLRITWSYLLLTVFGEHVPEFVKRWLGFQTPSVSKGTWTGDVMSYPDDPKDFRTGIAMLTVPKSRMDTVLNVCREEGGARFTGLLNQMIVLALSGAFAVHSPPESIDNVIGQIVVDLRGLVPAYSGDMMVNCVSALPAASALQQGEAEKGLQNDATFWNAVRTTTLRLADSANSRVDQPLGLLRYLDKFRPWFLEKLGKRRDSSYEISNAVVFDPSSKLNGKDARIGWTINKTVFSQPANVTSCPLSFSVVTIKEGDMVLTVNWQVGVLGVGDEDAFVGDVLGKIEDYLMDIGEN